MKELTQEKLKQLVEYDPISGDMTYLVGKKAGYKVRTYSGKYLSVHINGYRNRVHRLAFLYMTGTMPELIDHIDRNKENNAWSNLRAATHAQNNANNDAQKRSNTGVRGLRWCKTHKRWKGQCTYGGKVHTISRADRAYVEKWLASHHRKQIEWNKNG